MGNGHANLTDDLEELRKIAERLRQRAVEQQERADALWREREGVLKKIERIEKGK